MKFCQFMLISVKMAQPISFFFHQKMRNLYLGNYKKEGEKSLRVLTGDAKNEMLGPSGPPYTLKCISGPPLIHLSINVSNTTCIRY